MAIQVVFMGVLGLLVGGAVGVVAYRVPRQLSILAPVSRCPSCEAALARRECIPVASYLTLGGRCRHCGGRIPVVYPLLELGLAAAFIVVLLAFEGEPAAIGLALALITTLAAITVTDLERRVIPDRILAVSATVGIAIVALDDAGSLPERGIAAAAASGLLFLLATAYRGGMGMGDVKLAAVIGLYLGRAVAPALLVAFAVGAAYGLALIARDGLQARTRSVPFGPFLALGAIVGLFWGDEIVDWYLDAFFDG